MPMGYANKGMKGYGTGNPMSAKRVEMGDGLVKVVKIIRQPGYQEIQKKERVKGVFHNTKG